jgi:hypothetical protein
MTMSEENIFVPIDALDERLRKLIPAGDKILYTSKAEIFKTGFGGDKKYGYLLLTNNGVALRAGKIGAMTFSIYSAAKGALEDYIPYEDIIKFENKKDKVKLKRKIPEKPGDTRGWQLKVERCKDEGESKDSFKKRKDLFGRIFEDLMKKKTGR